MATELKPMTSEAIALTEKKMNMTLDEIIKESKKPSSKSRNTRVANKNRGSFQGNAAKVQQFMNSGAYLRQMVTKLKPMTSEAIALMEKKMNMTLDEIIKESKKPSSKSRNTWVPNKNRGLLNGDSFQGNAAKVQQFMDLGSYLRQGVLSQRRSNFTGNQFPLTAEVANKAAISPIHNKAFTYFRVGTWNKPRVPSIPVNREAAHEDAFTGKGCA
ncbi:uncharacterized protein [Aristolochia californica]|uniref:uncharacterized protein isoform X2 n=1 Tax=Aristolochia californica TaxID=171875 RepID=UPI0035DB6244